MARMTMVCFLYFLLLVKGIDMLTLSRVVERVNQMELRLLSETKYRTEDMSILLSKLDDINAKLNKLTVTGEATNEERSTVHTAIDNKQTTDSMGNIQSQFMRVLKGFEDEKRENRRTRRQVAAQQISINELNNMPTLVATMFNQMENSMKEIRNDIKQIHGDLTESIHEAKDDITRVNGDMVKTMETTKRYITDGHAYLSGSIKEVKDDIERVLDSNTNAESNGLSITLDDISGDISEAKIDIHNITHSLDRHMAAIYNVFSSCGSSAILEKDTSRQLLVGYARSCSDIKGFANISNVYNIYRSGKRIEVFCDQQTDGGGWTVFQRRQDGSENFNRSWSDYKEGFGNLLGEFWLGNEYMHLLTNEDVTSCELRVDMTDFEKDTAFAKYSSFKVGSESDKYKLEVKGYSGTAEDALTYQSGKEFQTYDQLGTTTCARAFNANWHNQCYLANPNGMYFTKAGVGTPSGIIWKKWKNESLKHIDMKFRCKRSH